MAIRVDISKQLDHLWQTHKALGVLKEEAWVNPHQPAHSFSSFGGVMMKRDGGDMTPRERAELMPHMICLYAPVTVGTQNHTPLVRKSLHLNCELDILFLRQEDPGELITQAGDIDNRIKTLFDALRMPSEQEQQAAPPPGDLFCLMESDTLVSALNVRTDRLLFPQTTYPNEVHLVIGVKLKLLHVDKTNACLL